MEHVIEFFCADGSKYLFGTFKTRPAAIAYAETIDEINGGRVVTYEVRRLVSRVD